MMDHVEVVKGSQGAAEKSKQAPNQQEIVSFLALGGLGEFGMNCLLIQSPIARVLLDCGVMFPSPEHLGVDAITPDFSVLGEQPLDALLLTHGHEDHIGSIQHLLRWSAERGWPTPLRVIGSRFTLALVRRRLEEARLLSSVRLELLQAGEIMELGDLQIEAVRVHHSVPDALAFAIDTPIGKIIHTGDWRIDSRPLLGDSTDLPRFGEIGSEGVRALFSDSTNVDVEGFSVSEAVVAEHLSDVLDLAPARVFVTLFSSNIARMQSLLRAAHATHRKVVLYGMSMKQNFAVARELGYITLPSPDILLDEAQMRQLPQDELVVLCGGSQGEPSSTLARIAFGDHADFRVCASDTLVFSSRSIPGNEKRIARVVDAFHRQGARVVLPTERRVHTTGHACAEEQRLLIGLLRPKLFVPVHGDFRQLTRHAELARSMGVEQTYCFSNGELLSLGEDEVKLARHHEPSHNYTIGKLFRGADDELLRQRRHLAHNGCVCVAIRVNRSGELLAEPRIRDFALVIEPNGLMAGLQRLIRSSVKDYDGPWEEEALSEHLRGEIRRYFSKQIDRRPVVLPLVLLE
ncbi:MAG: ribonuclease J [Myxococcota bacterium]|jgi:ribonuclease J|nr:ribonuclease J [Myxococcota bacterium]